MASNLQRKGYRLQVHDVNPEGVRALESLGAGAARGYGDLASGSDIVFTMLPNSAIVEDVIAGPNGVLSHARAGTLIVDMSTIDPLSTDRLAAASISRNCSFIDAPVGRLAAHAERGECLFMVGASDADFDRVRPLLEAMGTTIHRCGRPGTGMRTKLVNNYLAIVSCQLNAEALALSQRFGLSLANTLNVVHGTTATNGQLRINWPDKVLAGDLEPGFTIDLAHKDLTLIVDAANAERVPMPIGAAAREAFTTARSRGFGSNDFSAMVDALCDLAGIAKPRI